MTKINLDELIADREAGTDGPWEVQKSPFEVINRDHGFLPNLIIAGDDIMLAALYPENIEDPDARRIARLPDLEAAYIEAVETLRVIAAEAYVAVDEGYPGTWRNVAVERIDIARAFLERNT